MRTLDSNDVPSGKLTQISEQLDDIKMKYEKILDSEYSEREGLIISLSEEINTMMAAILELKDEDVIFPDDFETTLQLIKYFQKGSGISVGREIFDKIYLNLILFTEF